ncbi:MAG TPA: hypothetical protein VMW94_02305 [Actinomycetes bacterium]|nr:hypothetical protein [Actinomycetes bacterium]
MTWRIGRDSSRLLTDARAQLPGDARGVSATTPTMRNLEER